MHIAAYSISYKGRVVNETNFYSVVNILFLTTARHFALLFLWINKVATIQHKTLAVEDFGNRIATLGKKH